MDGLTTIGSPEILSLILGGAATLAALWVRDRIDSALTTAREAREAAAKSRDSALEESDDWHAFAKSIAESMASVAATIKHQGERIDRLEGGADAAAANSAELHRTVVVNGEQARVAIADMADIKASVRQLSETTIRMGALLEAHDRRTIDTANRVDALAIIRGDTAHKVDEVYRLLRGAIPHAPAAVS